MLFGYIFQTESLWVAPELLRDPKRNLTKEGDIYSVGIIMKEIATREGPYDAESKYMQLSGNQQLKYLAVSVLNEFIT